jgi:hypothetical protein
MSTAATIFRPDRLDTGLVMDDTIDTTMEREEPLLHISEQDITEANRLSLSCPICASAVENNVDSSALMPVVCANCQTLYHRACWEQNGRKCAVLGCEHKTAQPYGTALGPRLIIKHSDLPRHVPRRPSPNGRYRALKEAEKRRQREETGGSFWNSLFQNILRAIGWRR